MIRKINFILLLVLAISAFGQVPAQAKRVEGYRFRSTLITPYLIRRVLPGKNMLYISTFQIVWNKFADEISRQTIALDGKPIMMQMLNRRLTGAQDVSEEYYFAMAGTKEDDISDMVIQTLSDKFDETPAIDLTLENPHDILLYTFLVKDITFSEEFERLEKPIMFNGSSPVRGFGMKEFVLDESHIRAGEQVEVIYYNNDNDFVIRLRSRNQDDEIYLAKIPPLKTMAATSSYVLTQVNINRPQGLKVKDTLQIPIIDVDVVDWFLDLEGRCLQSRGMEDFCVARAVQSIKFRLVQDADPYELLPSVGEQREITKPRKFIFDKPFLLLLRRENAGYPYFVLWVENTELLTEAK
jgi:hypothetical protein